MALISGGNPNEPIIPGDSIAPRQPVTPGGTFGPATIPESDSYVPVWVEAAQEKKKAEEDCARKALAWLTELKMLPIEVIAHAFVDKGIVVTQESSLRPAAHKARIPDVCKHFGVPCMDGIQMMKKLKAKI